MLNIVYEDNHIIVVVKPQNIPTQEDITKDKDLLTMVKEYIKEKYNKPGNVYVGLVHRLDRPTGGLMVFAKTSKAAARLCNDIKDGNFDKKYLSVVVGRPQFSTNQLVNFLKKNEKDNIVQIVPQGEEGAKKAVLNYKVLSSKDRLSLVDIELETGRSHQIRVQFSGINCPVFGDVKYGGDIVKGWNLALWAYSLRFIHPVTKQVMNFCCYPPVEDTPWKFFDIKNLENL